MVEVRDLVKRYGEHVALDHLSFSVEKGCVYGFLGPNGAGKSTAMNIMTGYLTATSGQVLVDGHSISEEPDEVKSRIGYLPEIPPLYVDMTVKEYMEFSAGLKKIPRDQIRPQIDKVTEMARISDVSGRLIKNLSKGYRQRVGLAQALIGFPEILILDEPTVGLDPKQITEIRSLIRELSGEHTIILSSHILSEVQEVCDHIMIIHHGRMVSHGTPAELEKELAGEPALTLTVKASPEAARAALSGIDGEKSLDVAQTGESAETAVKITYDKGADLRERVFNACVSSGIPLLEMKRESVSLEQIFLELTSDSPRRAARKKGVKARIRTAEAGKKADAADAPADVGDENATYAADAGEEAAK